VAATPTGTRTAMMGRDPFAQWLLCRRYGGDRARAASVSDHLRTVRDRVLDLAGVAAGDVVLDVGCGDGLIGFGALPSVGEGGAVVFSDISPELLDCCRVRARELGVLDRCRFIQAAAEDLAAIPDASVDVVAMRSVLIYAAEKRRACREFWRVLKDGGRLALAEPVARFFGFPPPAHLFGWQTLYDVTPVQDLAGKVQAVFAQVRSPASPMMDFTARDLVDFAEAAGFADLTLDLRVELRPARSVSNWNAWWLSAPNPLAPSFAEAVAQALSDDEARRFVAHLRPLVERGEGQRRSALAFLRAVKTPASPRGWKDGNHAQSDVP